MDFVTRYASHILEREPDECWNWQLSCNSWGYGQVVYRYRGRLVYIGAHVLGLVLASGEDQNGRSALHTCDNPACCNPAHLYWGTHTDNMRDRTARGRASNQWIAGTANQTLHRGPDGRFAARTMPE